jgi:hypothetical protein
LILLGKGYLPGAPAAVEANILVLSPKNMMFCFTQLVPSVKVCTAQRQTLSIDKMECLSSIGFSFEELLERTTKSQGRHGIRVGKTISRNWKLLKRKRTSQCYLPRKETI